MPNQPFNITLSVPSGNPDKLRIIEKTNRLSMGLVFNRDELAEVAKNRVEITYTGVYMLLNNNNAALPEIYIGEGESVVQRLKKHNKEKEFWEWCVVFVNRDNSLHKAHIQHLEAALVERALANKRCIVKNDVSPKPPSLPESVLFEAEDLLNDIYQIVPLLGLTVFEVVTHNPQEQASETLFINTKGITATAFQTGGKITVKAESQVVKNCVQSISSGHSSLRLTLLEQGVLLEQDNHYVFVQDYTFDSPSTAAAVVTGSSVNGRTAWRTQQGVTLKQIQEKAIEDNVSG